MKNKRLVLGFFSILCLATVFFAPGPIIGANLRNSDQRDPFIPLVTEKGRETSPLPELSSLEPGITLQAILTGQKKRGAIINNHFLLEGDVIPEASEAKVVSVEKDRVIVKYRLNNYQLRMWDFRIIIKDFPEKIIIKELPNKKGL
jgi:hypothetical protein